RRGSKQGNGRKNCHFHQHGATPLRLSVCPSWLVSPKIVYRKRIATTEAHAFGRTRTKGTKPFPESPSVLETVRMTLTQSSVKALSRGAAGTIRLRVLRPAPTARSPKCLDRTI